MWLSRGLLLVVLVAATLPGSAAWAQIVLKPNGENALPLRPKTLAADISIDRHFASLRMTWTFQNESDRRMEADFLYSLPPDTLVTAFAYWFGKERVPARIMEKEKAAAIYRHITSRQRDPALIDLVGKKTFRARIFPVEPNADLKVEMTMAQTLQADARGSFLMFPLQMARGTALDSVRLNVRVRARGGTVQVTNSYGLAVRREGDAFRMTLNARNYRPQRDFRVTLLRKPQPLQAELTTSPAPGGGGYFALAIVPDRILKKPRVKILGVQTEQIAPAILPTAKAYRALTLCGRYRGSGKAMVTVSGHTLRGWKQFTQPVTFPAQPERRDVAAKLWAVKRMEQLGGDPRQRKAVVALSHRFGIPSKYTSWLAVPKVEWQRYQEEKRQERLYREKESVARRLAQEIIAGRERGRTGRLLLARLKSLYIQMGYSRDPKSLHGSVEDEISSHLHSAAQRLAVQMALERLRKRTHSAQHRLLRQRFNRLSRRLGNSPQSFLRELQGDTFNSAAEQVAERLGRLILKHRENGPEAKRLWRDLRLINQASRDSYSHYVGYYLTADMDRVAHAIALEKRAPRPNLARMADLKRELERLARYGRVSANRQIQDAERGLIYEEKDRVLEELRTEHIEDLPDRAAIRRLESRYLELSRQANDDNSAQATDYDKARLERLAVKAERRRLDIELATISPRQAEELRKRKGELDRREAELRARMGDPLISVEAPADAVQVIAILPGGEIKRLAYDAANRRWIARFDIPTYAREGAYVITVLIVHRDGARQKLTMRYHVDITPPAGAGRAQVVAGSGPVLRLELEASADTARVKALLPWGRQVALAPSAGRKGRFLALVPLMPEQRRAAQVVTYVLTDRAHNRTVIQVDMSAPAGG